MTLFCKNMVLSDDKTNFYWSACKKSNVTACDPNDPLKLKNLNFLQ